MIYPIQNNEQIIAGHQNLLMLLNGTITIEKGDQVNAIPAKSFFFFDESFAIVAASPFVEGFVLKISSERLQQYPDLATNLAEDISPFKIRKIQKPEDKRNKVISLLEAPENSILSESYAHILWSEFVSDYQNSQQDQTTIEQFSQLIEENIEQNYCAGTYAEMMGIPLKKLIREVKASENKTPCNFITEKVIEKAKYKLLHSDDTSQMIAYQLGFDDQYYFIKYFKKSTDLTPTQFRAQYATAG